MEELVNKSDELGCQIESSGMGEIFKGPLMSYTLPQSLVSIFSLIPILTSKVNFWILQYTFQKQSCRAKNSSIHFLLCS